MRTIIYTRLDGGLSVVNPCINTFPIRESITEAQAEQRAWDKLPKDAINPQWIESDKVPTDRTFRNAWKAGSGAVEHDMEKSREIHRERMRRVRAPLLAALDMQYLRADEAGDTALKASIAGRKQRLRDVTADPAIDAAATPDELKAMWPEVLA